MNDVFLILIGIAALYFFVVLVSQVIRNIHNSQAILSILLLFSYSVFFVYQVFKPFDVVFLAGTADFRFFGETIAQLNRSVEYFLIYFFGNIGLLLPFGMFLPIIHRRLGSRVILVGFLMSLITEVSQYMFFGRIAQVDDLILNTFGVIVGYVFYIILFRQGNQKGRVRR